MTATFAPFFGSGSGSLTIGTTPIAGGTDTRVLFQDGAAVGQNAGLTFNKTTGVLTVAAVAGSVQSFVFSNLGIT